jgi:hypothetical protein
MQRDCGSKKRKKAADEETLSPLTISSSYASNTMACPHQLNSPTAPVVVRTPTDECKVFLPSRPFFFVDDR